MLFKDFVQILLEQPNNPYPTVDVPFILGFGEKNTDDVPCISWNFLGATQLKTNVHIPEIDCAWKMIHFQKKDGPLVQRTFVNKKIQGGFSPSKSTVYRYQT